MFDFLKGPLAGCLACITGLVVVRALAYEVQPFEWLDAHALHSLASERGSFVDPGASLFVHLADPLPQFALLAVVFFGARRWGRPRLAVAAVALVAGANLTTQALKVMLAHPRYQSLLGSDQIPSTAFPSGHATTSMAMALAFVFGAPRSTRTKAISVGACLVAVIGCSLVILRRHYPSDVLGGWLVALGWGCATVAALRIDQRFLAA